MLYAVYGGVTIWRGEAHRIGVAEVETQASKTIPSIPAGAALFCDCPEEAGRFMGYVTDIRPAQLERWLLKLDEAVAGTATMAGETLQEAAGAESPPAAFQSGGTPIDALRPLSTARTWAAIKDAAQTVEEIAVMSDAALLSLAGVGTRSLNEVRRNCAKLLQAGDGGL
jgi:hypothetical protein